jgi:hypothetical protein
MQNDNLTDDSSDSENSDSEDDEGEIDSSFKSLFINKSLNKPSSSLLLSFSCKRKLQECKSG